MFFGAENNQLANDVFDKIQAFEQKAERVVIINPYSSLRLFEGFFKMPSEEQTQSNAEFEVIFF